MLLVHLVLSNRGALHFAKNISAQLTFRKSIFLYPFSYSGEFENERITF